MPLPDRRNASSPIHNFTAAALASLRSLPNVAFALYWVWELPNQASTWSIVPGADDYTIDLLLRS